MIVSQPSDKSLTRLAARSRRADAPDFRAFPGKPGRCRVDGEGPIWFAALAMFLPMIVLGQVDGPAVSRYVSLAMGLAALASLSLGLHWNRGGAPGEPAKHSFLRRPLQVWVAPMLIFAVLLGTGTITTPQEPRANRQVPALVGGSKSP